LNAVLPLPSSTAIGVSEVTALVDRGRVTPFVTGVDLTPVLARLVANPKTHEGAVARIAEAVLDRYVYLTGRDLDPRAVRAEVEKGLRRRFYRPGEVAVVVGTLEPCPLGPRPSVAETDI